MFSSTNTMFLVVLWLCVTSSVSGGSLDERERQRLQQLEQSVGLLSRQLMMMQMTQEEAWRSDGDSGIKQVRLNRDGTRTYHSNTHTGTSVAAIHEHSNMPGTCGMGEIEAVLNGVHFRTRHNDYPLRMPINTGEYDGTAEIPFPLVPPAVLKKRTVEEQAKEMREWFRAWRNGDTKHRDYRPYFKALLCYLEGAWTTDLSMKEPLHSDRHQLDADSWADLQEKIRFTSYTGDKNPDENFAFLPTMILNVTDGVPAMAQWSYRILCHPLRHDVRLSDLKPVDDLSARMALKDTWEDYVKSRAARFALNPFSEEKSFKWTQLDKIMKQIPGKDNYGARITDKTLGGVKLNAHNSSPLNTAYYHRRYKTAKAGAMGERVSHRGFADRNLFVAETTQPRVAPMTFKTCRTLSRGRRSCVTHTKRVSYAIPLEIVFLTPLHTWNPYDLEYKGPNLSELGRTVVADGRKGRATPESAFNGTNNRHFYQTPSLFFSGGEVNSDPADTVKGVVGVLDRRGHVRSVVASGIRIFLPEIRDVGVLRTRYPIMPVYAEGNVVWKELEALRDVVLNMQEHLKYLYKVPNFPDSPSREKERKKDSNGTKQNAEEDFDSNATSDVAKNVRIRARSEVKDHKVTDSKVKGTNVKDKVKGKKFKDKKVKDDTEQRRPAVLDPGSRDRISFSDNRSRSALTSGNTVLSNIPPSAMMGYIEALQPRSGAVTLVTSPSTRTYVTMHVHTVQLNRAQVRATTKLGRKVVVRTTLEGGHSHLLTVGFNSLTQYFYIELCDQRAKCWDGHSMNLEKIGNNVLPTGLRGFG